MRSGRGCFCPSTYNDPRRCLHPTYITCCTIPYFFFHVLHDVARCFARFRNVRVAYGPKSWTPKNGCVFYSPPIGWAQRMKLEKFRFLTNESRQKPWTHPVNNYWLLYLYYCCLGGYSNFMFSTTCCWETE